MVLESACGRDRVNHSGPTVLLVVSNWTKQLVELHSPPHLGAPPVSNGRITALKGNAFKGSAGEYQEWARLLLLVSWHLRAFKLVGGGAITFSLVRLQWPGSGAQLPVFPEHRQLGSPQPSKPHTLPSPPPPPPPPSPP
ncbi:unnamed protein product [Arctogadus glacialis]